MERAWAYVKEHPWTIAGIIGVLVLAYFFLGSSSSTSSAQSSSGQPTDAQVNAGTQLSLAQMQLTAAGNQTAAQLAASENNNASQVTIAGLNAATSQYTVEQQANVAALNVVEGADVAKANLSTQEVVAGYQLQLGLAEQATTAQINSTNAATYQHLADVQSQTTIASYNAQTVQTEAYVNADVQKAQISAGTAKQKSSNNLLGSIAGGIIGLFSDERLKCNIETVGFDACGRRWVDYNYIWDTTVKFRGVIAQEILLSDPSAVSVGPMGYLMVNYGMLN